jgi:parallel beta-helix repeat protein
MRISRLRRHQFLGGFCTVAVLLIFLFSAFNVSSSARSLASSRTIYVNASNVSDPDEDGSYAHPFDQIEEGINASSCGDTIVVAAGVYHEEVYLSENKSGISLVGEEGAIIDGEGRRNGLRIGILMTVPDYLDNVSVSGLTVRNCVHGINLMRTRYARLRNNTMIGNLYNFADYSLQINDVDTSNTVDGKPIYYWVNEHDRQIPSDAGFVALVDSRNITVRDLNLTHNGHGVLLKNTTSSIVENDSFVNNQDGIYLDHYCTNNTITGNNVVDNGFIGVYVSASSGNVLRDNNMLGNEYGVYLAASSGECSENLVVNNTIEGHWKGIVLQGDPNLPIRDNVIENNIVSDNGIAISMYLTISNLIYHNNFVNNTDQIETSESQNMFDRLGEGNYWSNYNGSDANHDGIGDTSYIIDEENQDDFPLMGLFKSLSLVWDGTTYALETISNSLVSEFNFSQPDRSIAFFLGKSRNATGFCRIAIPKVLLGGPYQIQVNGSPAIISNEQSNDTYSFLFFLYSGDDNQIEIVGSTVVSEFLPFSFLLAFLMITICVFFLRKKVAFAVQRLRE